MKIPSLISAILLGLAIHVHAQQQSPPAPLPTPESAPRPVTPDAKDPGLAKYKALNGDGSMTLKAGTLGEMVDEIRWRVGLSGFWPNVDASTKMEMPNLLFSDGTREATVPGEVTMRDVKPLQALALAAAAAGCIVEPVMDPEPGLATAPPKVIGYQVMLSAARNRGVSFVSRQSVDILSGVGLVLSKKEGAIVVGELVPGSPAAAQSAIQPGQQVLSVADGGKPAVDATKMELEQVVSLLRGAAGMPVTITFGSGNGAEMKKHTVTLVRANLSLKTDTGVPLDKDALEQARRYEYVVREAHEQNQVGFPVQVPRWTSQPKVTTMGGGGGNDKGSRDLFGSSSRGTGPALPEAPADNKLPIVRVYALGSAIVDRPGESYEEKKRKEQLVAGIEDLIGQTLGTAGLDNTSPKLSFHYGLGVLVAKASSAQHEMIEQVVKALRESGPQAAQNPSAIPEPPRPSTGVPAK